MPRILVKTDGNYAIWSTTEKIFLTEKMSKDKMHEYLILQEMAWESNYGLTEEVKSQIKLRVEKMFSQLDDSKAETNATRTL